MRTFSRPGSLSGLGKFLGSEGMEEDPLQSITINKQEVLYYKVRPLKPRLSRLIFLGYKISGFRVRDQMVDIDYNPNISREDRMTLMGKFKNIGIRFGE